MKNDITVAENKINDLKTRRDVLNKVIQETLAEKRQIDKYGLELVEAIDGRSMNEDQIKKRQRNEERKLKINKETNLENLRQQGVILIEQTADEENKSKEVLDNKLELEQQLMDLKQKVMKDSTIK